MRRPSLAVISIHLLCLVLTGCALRSPAAGLPPLPSSTSAVRAYALGTGDKVKVSVYGEESLSGEFVVSDTGALDLPLIGRVKAAGLTIAQLTDAIRKRLSESYLQDPKVALEIENYRPVYVMGEVEKPGDYPYTSGMTVTNAVAVAGGYTKRAGKDAAIVKRAGKEYRADPDAALLPEDVVKVPERFF